MTIERDAIVGVLLAGGLARRMGGGDKSMNTVGGVPILERVVARIKPQVGTLILNANGNPSRFAELGLPVVADVLDDHPGPLAGVLTGMEWSRAMRPSVPWIATVATDAPFVPLDLIARLAAAAEAAGALIACAQSNGRTHPPFAVWSIDLADDLKTALVDEGLRKIDAWTARHPIVHVEFSTDPVDPFFNVNKPDNLAEADALAQAVDEAGA